ncbi:MAG: NADH-quinone oxidoreductase subunit J [Deltaproteobacteria bacterium]|nr:NADH-quinone oxidoreductase subunit J [Deltaproteobacteria bacterium]
MTHTVLFYIGAAVSVAAAVGVIYARNVLRGALLLIVSLCGVALLFLLLDASFVAAMQILVYACAIMVHVVFVIMMLNLGPDRSNRPAYFSIAKAVGVVAAGYFAFRIIADVTGGAGKPVDGSVKRIGTLLLSDYLFAFEAISVLLLVAVVGAVVLGLKRLD